MIKIELPSIGDHAATFRCSRTDDRRATFVAGDGSERSLALDLRQENGAGAFRRLVAGADVAIGSFTRGRSTAGGSTATTSRPSIPMCSSKARIRTALRRRAESEPFRLAELAIRCDERQISLVGTTPMRIS